MLWVARGGGARGGGVARGGDNFCWGGPTGGDGTLSCGRVTLEWG